MPSFLGPILALAVLVMAAASDRAGAQTELPKQFFPGIIGKDNRLALEATEPPYSAIGRLNVAGFSRLRQCSGFLVSPSVVVTAAHCVYDAYKKRPLAAGRFHFLAGWQKQKFLAHGIGKCVAVMDDFKPIKRPTLENFAKDVAIIILREPIDIAPLSFADDNLIKEDTMLVHAGYSRDKRHLLMGDANCSVLEEHEGVLLTDCDTNHGASGGPVMVLDQDGKPHIAGIMVGGYSLDFNVAVRASAFQEFATAAQCE